MELSKNTVVSASLATLLTFVGSIWMASQFVQNKVGLIDANASGVAYLTQQRVQDIIRGLKRDLRELEAENRANPNEYVQRDIDATEDDIDYYEKVLDCLRAGNTDCE